MNGHFCSTHHYNRFDTSPFMKEPDPVTNAIPVSCSAAGSLSVICNSNDPGVCYRTPTFIKTVIVPCTCIVYDPYVVCTVSLHVYLYRILSKEGSIHV